jgi:hypothetical protein
MRGRRPSRVSKRLALIFQSSLNNTEVRWTGKVSVTGFVGKIVGTVVPTRTTWLLSMDFPLVPANHFFHLTYSIFLLSPQGLYLVYMDIGVDLEFPLVTWNSRRPRQIDPPALGKSNMLALPL